MNSSHLVLKVLFTIFLLIKIDNSANIHDLRESLKIKSKLRLKNKNKVK